MAKKKVIRVMVTIVIASLIILPIIGSLRRAMEIKTSPDLGGKSTIDFINLLGSVVP